MGLLNETYMPELELFGDRYDVNVYNRIHNLQPNYIALESVIGKSPKSKTFDVGGQKVLKLVAAIILTSVNIDNRTLTKDAQLLITKVAKVLYPALETVEFGISHHWGNLNWDVGIRIAGKFINLWSIDHHNRSRNHYSQKTTRLAPFKRNKGNKVTCMRKVERLRKL